MKNAMSLRGCVASVAITIPLFLLAACGDDITEQYNANVGAVETSKDLPECTKDIAGQTAFVSETHEFLGCDGKEWQTLSANTVSVGDNVCSSTSLSDDSGFEIFCNGKSIGKVKNGEKGDAGTPGAKGEAGTNGTGCKIQESTALTATIACGSETFTMDLTGYVDVPEACDTTDTDCAKPLNNVDLSGVSQKGPFVSGTDVTAYELENGKSLKQTGKTFGGKIENKDGSFNIRTVKLKSSFAYLVADGFYRNEVTGKNSAATIKLRALTNLDGRSTANINLVTHLEYDRVQRLVTKENKSVIEAKRAAEKSLFAAFGIDNANFKGFAEDFNILKEGDGNAALLAVSAMLQGDRNESELTALLAALSIDLGDNGEWDDSLQRAQVADWAMKADLEGGLSKIRANVEGWKLSTSKAPAFEGHVKNFWMKELGVDDCDFDNNGALFAVKNTYSSFYAANDSAYTEGDSSLTRLICAVSGDSYAWRFATDIEKDVAVLPADADDGAVTSGSINTGLVYVKEGEWRRGTDLDIRLKASCVANSLGITDSTIVKSVVTWYICDDGDAAIPFAWREATAAEADTAGFGIPETEKDSVKIGNINKSRYYVYEENKWRFGTDLDYGLGPCTGSKVGSVDTTSKGKWYKCVGDKSSFVEGVAVPTEWREATNYEMDTYNREGVLGDLIRGSVNKNLFYVKDSAGWRPATDLEKTLLGPCTKAQKGAVNQSDTVSMESWYKCTNEFSAVVDTFSVAYTWRKATNLEKDTLGWTRDTAEGAFRNGKVNVDMVYVFEEEKKSWRHGTSLDSILHLSCISSRKGSLVQVSIVEWYKCVGDTAVSFEESNWTSVWRRATDLEIDMVYWENNNIENGTLLKGSFTGRTLVWDDGALREANDTELWGGLACVKAKYGEIDTLSNGLAYTCNETGWSKTGTFEDFRDQKIYKGVQIGTQTWMAENLNYEYKVWNLESQSNELVPYGSFCYNDDPVNCEKFGRLYYWSAAMDSAGREYENWGRSCGYNTTCTVVPPVRGICPRGWHLPTRAELRTLIEYAGGWRTAGGVLKSQTGWIDEDGISGDGLDTLFFSGLPAGARNYDGSYYNMGYKTYFWSSIELSKEDAQYMTLYYYNTEASSPSDYKYLGFSVRCIKD